MLTAPLDMLHRFIHLFPSLASVAWINGNAAAARYFAIDTTAVAPKQNNDQAVDDTPGGFSLPGREHDRL